MNLSLRMIAQMSQADLRDLPEADFSKAVVAYAQEGGWQVHYERRSGHVGTDGKWRGSGPKGKPDLTLARDGKVLLSELKTEDGKLSAEQKVWLDAAGEHGRLWRPRDASEIIQTLR